MSSNIEVKSSKYIIFKPFKLIKLGGITCFFDISHKFVSGWKKRIDL